MKSTQEPSDELYNIFAQVQEVDEQIYYSIIEMLRKENISDCIGFLSKFDNQKQLVEYLNLQKKNKLGNNYINNTTNIIKLIQDNDFNKQNYSQEIYKDLKKNLIKKISQDMKIIQFLKFFVLSQPQITLQYNVVEMKVDLKYTNFENIKIQNTSLVGSNFVRCNLSGSQFKNVDISGMNLNGARLFNCKWKNIKIHELNKLHGHSDGVNSVCFSPDGTTLASGSGNNSIGRSKDNSIRLWDIKQDNQKANWMVINVLFSQYVFLLMGICQHLVVKINLSVYGMLKQDNNNLNQMVHTLIKGCSIFQVNGITKYGIPRDFSKLMVQQNMETFVRSNNQAQSKPPCFVNREIIFYNIKFFLQSSQQLLLLIHTLSIHTHIIVRYVKQKFIKTN